MADPRTPRDLNARDKTAREVYVPPGALPDPTMDPGWDYRWVATHVLGKSEVRNASAQFRDGWAPVKASDHPELALGTSENGNVEIGGLILCKRPSERSRARDQYYQRMNENLVESLDNNFMRNNDPRMPLFSEKKSAVSFGKGR